MSKQLALSFVASVAALTITEHAQAATVDFKPINGYFDVSSNNSDYYTGAAQSFQAVDTHISFGFYAFSYTTQENLVFTLLEGDGLSGKVLSTKTAKTPPYSYNRSDNFVGVTFRDATLIVGKAYTVKLTTDYGEAPPGGYSKTGVFVSGSSNPYAGGRFYKVNSLYNVYYGNYDLAFKMTGIPGVPEPASWAMLIAGFGAAGGAVRRGRRKREALKLA